MFWPAKTLIENYFYPRKIVCKTMVGRLSAAIAQQRDVSVQLEALDILGDLLSRFGGLLIQFHPNLLEALQPQLKSPRLAVRKR